MRGRFGGTRTRRSKMPYGGARGLGVGALALLGTISLLMLLRRRAKRNGNSTEEIGEHPQPREDEGRSEREQASARRHREYFRKLIEETNERSRSSGENRGARGRPAREQERGIRIERGDEQAGRRDSGREDHTHDDEELRVQRTEEELEAGTREREAGEVRVRKQVRTEREQLRVPTRHEEVSVERVPVEGQEASEAEIGEDEVEIPVVKEEVVVEKRPVVKEEIRVRKDIVEEEEVVEEDVRREEVDVEDATERGRREAETEQAAQPESGAEAEETAEEEGVIDKAKRKLQGQ